MTRRAPRRLAAAVEGGDVPRGRWLLASWERRVVRWIARREVEEAARKVLIVVGLRSALEYRRRCLPPWICPSCAHDRGQHHFERRLSMTRDHHGTSARMTVLWDCMTWGCRCSGEWPRGAPGPDRAVQDFITRAFRVARDARGIR